MFYNDSDVICETGYGIRIDNIKTTAAMLRKYLALSPKILDGIKGTCPDVTDKPFEKCSLQELFDAISEYADIFPKGDIMAQLFVIGKVRTDGVVTHSLVTISKGWQVYTDPTGEMWFMHSSTQFNEEVERGSVNMWKTVNGKAAFAPSIEEISEYNKVAEVYSPHKEGDIIFDMEYINTVKEDHLDSTLAVGTIDIRQVLNENKAILYFYGSKGTVKQLLTSFAKSNGLPESEFKPSYNLLFSRCIIPQNLLEEFFHKTTDEGITLLVSDKEVKNAGHSSVFC